MISAVPINCFLVNFSLRKKKPRTATKTYPSDSTTGAMESGTTFKENIERRVHPKKSRYPTITKGFRYSRSLFGYFLSAAFFKRICETEEMKTLPVRISVYRRSSLFIGVLLFCALGLFAVGDHHDDSGKHDESAENIREGDRFLKDENAKQHAPQKGDCFVGIGEI